jgi:isopentenyl-diphosphate Delta-isomerase
MAELLDVLDEQGNATGRTKTKDAILRDGDWRRVVHIWVVDDHDQLLIQQRAVGRGIFDSLWDVSVGGGVRAGEPSIEAARRELQEELGLDAAIDRFTLLGTWKLPPKPVDEHRVMKDFSDTFLVRLPAIDKTALHLEPKEVQAVDTLGLAELYGQIESSAFYARWVQHGPAYYREVIDAIRRHQP